MLLYVLIMLFCHVVTVRVHAAGTKVYIHVYLPYRGAISFYVCLVPSGLISMFLFVGRV